MENKTLLIYNLYPEEIKLYIIPGAPDWLVKCHGVMVNSVKMTDAQGKLMERVYDAIQEKPEYYSDPNDPLAGAWVQYKKDPDLVTNLAPCYLTIVSCGFIL